MSATYAPDPYYSRVRMSERKFVEKSRVKHFYLLSTIGYSSLYTGGSGQIGHTMHRIASR